MSRSPSERSTTNPPTLETTNPGKARAIEQFLAERGVSFRTEIVRNRVTKAVRYVITQLD
jgi:hypothetical protein